MVWNLKHGYSMNEEMSKYCGQTLTVSSVKIYDRSTNNLYYTFKECKLPYLWSPQLIEKLVKDGKNQCLIRTVSKL